MISSSEPFDGMCRLSRLDMARKITYDDAAKQRAQEGVNFDGMAAEVRLTEDAVRAAGRARGVEPQRPAVRQRPGGQKGGHCTRE